MKRRDAEFRRGQFKGSRAAAHGNRKKQKPTKSQAKIDWQPNIRNIIGRCERVFLGSLLLGSSLWVGYMACKQFEMSMDDANHILGATDILVFRTALLKTLFGALGFATWLYVAFLTPKIGFYDLEHVAHRSEALPSSLAAPYEYSYYCKSVE